MKRAVIQFKLRHGGVLGTHAGGGQWVLVVASVLLGDVGQQEGDVALLLVEGEAGEAEGAGHRWVHHVEVLLTLQVVEGESVVVPRHTSSHLDPQQTCARFRARQRDLEGSALLGGSVSP
ncbi:hypothetical protein E2C01_008983 [Portunus trituberculatus]|uniref:Uncharacterized protein n=1 Tax=Portunus trituberculatus TaxID=210409 RepID=A0A5B7D282_PORTR|nr:hypothetical protein [Portunus trituberculatus]